MAQVNRTNIFTLLEDQEETPARPQAKQTQVKARNEPAKVLPNINESRKTGKEPTNQEKAKHQAPAQKDRQSRTGRGKEVKKGGAGQHNWGNPQQIDQIPIQEESQEKKKYRKKQIEVQEEQENAPEVEPVITMSEWMGIETIVQEEVKNDGLLQFRIPRGRGRGKRRGEGPRKAQNTRPQPTTAPVFSDNDFPALGQIGK